MMQYMLIFITGLTAGGLSCLAVQGGLLASSFSNQIEKEFSARGRKIPRARSAAQPRLALPILFFLTSKLAAYTLLGFLLGALGSMLQLTLMARGILQLLVGIFMLGNALRMLNVHPFFRYFSIEPPRFLTRFIRRKSKGDATAFVPIFLGALTVLIPCGVAQAVMAAALGTSNPLAGALMMFSFTLGTTPVFFIISYFAMRLGSVMERYFNAFVAVVLLVLGLVAIETGLNLVGSPISLARLTERSSPPQVLVTAGSPALAQPATQAAVKTATPALVQAVQPPLEQAGPQAPGSTQGDESQLNSQDAVPAEDPAHNVFTVKALNYGYQPNVVVAKAGLPLTINMVTQNTQSCSRSVVFPAINLQKILPETGLVTINIPPQAKGTKMPFSCSMGMYTGEIVFE